MKRCLAVFFVLVSVSWGRTPDGFLDLILLPNNGIPSIIKQGERLHIQARRKGEVMLVREDERFPLAVDWKEMPGDLLSGTAEIPQDVGIGSYALELVADHTDRNSRAVYVVKEFPKEYTVVHITDIHIGSNRHPKPSEMIFRELATRVNEKCRQIDLDWQSNQRQDGSTSEAQTAEPIPPVAFVLITGDLTEGGEAVQFQTLVDLLDLFELPTFVCAGNHDRNSLNYEKTFDQLTYCFYFGLDGFLFFDTKDFLIADEAGPQDGLLERYREAIMPARWSIGATHRYDPTMGMRSQLTLFVDKPLDFLFYGHVHREANPEERVVPWGTTPVCITPAGIDGAYRLVTIFENRILPHETEIAVSIQ